GRSHEASCWRSRVWRPVFLFHANGAPGRPPRAVRARCKRQALPSMAGRAGNEGGLKPPGTSRRSASVAQLPEARLLGTRDATWSAGRRARRSPWRAGAFAKVPRTTPAPFGAPLLHVREPEETAPPQRRTVGGADDARLQDSSIFESEN